MRSKGLAKAVQQKLVRQRKEENRLLESITELADYETAEAAADIYAVGKHAYSYEDYLYQLSKLQTVLKAGIPADIALVSVDSCLDAEAIIADYKSISGRK